MSKRKATASKPDRGPKVATRAQRNKQALVRSSKESFLRSVAAASVEPPLRIDDELKREAPIIEKGVVTLQEDLSRKMRESDPAKAFALGTANMPAYQPKLLEIAQANVQFAFEFTLRLATIKSPTEFFVVIAEFTSRRMDMFAQQSKEMAAYPFWRVEAPREVQASPRQ
jgi:hypothetical protein